MENRRYEKPKRENDFGGYLKKTLCFIGKTIGNMLGSVCWSGTWFWTVSPDLVHPARSKARTTNIICFFINGSFIVFHILLIIVC